MSQFSAYTRAEGEIPYFSHLPNVGAAPTGTVVKKLFIDNRDRYDAANTSPFAFSIYMGNDPYRSVGTSGFENVQSVELKAIAFPKVANERYVVVRIDELKDTLLSASCQPAEHSFAVVYFDSDALGTGVVKPLKGIDFYQKQLVFKPPLAKLNSLNIRFLKHNGNVVTTADTAGVTHVSLLLEITTRAHRV